MKAGNGTDYLLAFVIVQFEFGEKTLDGMSFNYFFKFKKRSANSSLAAYKEIIAVDKGKHC